MPCSDGGPVYIGHDETRISYKELNAMKSRLDLVTRLLCGLMHDLQENEPEICSDVLDHVDELQDWWEKHQEADRKRLRKQRIQRRKKLRELKLWLRENKSDAKFLRQKLKQLKELSDDDYDARDFDFNSRGD